MTPLTRYSRRAILRRIGAAGALTFLSWGGIGPLLAAGAKSATLRSTKGLRKDILNHVLETPMVDTHEHLPDESDALRGKAGGSLWTVLFSHYLDSDLRVAGMSRSDLDQFLGPGLAPKAKWKLLEPYWPAVKNTGYGQAVRIAIRELY